MGTNPEIEKPTRDLLGHTIRGEWDNLAGVIEAIGEERYIACLALCLQIAAYIGIDIVGHEWPSYAKLRDIARLIAEMEDMEYDLRESDVYDFLARCALGFEPLAEVFPDWGKVGDVTVSTTASLLVAYRPGGIHWWEYLDLIERALEAATRLGEELIPAMLLLTRRQRALKAREAKPGDDVQLSGSDAIVFTQTERKDDMITRGQAGQIAEQFAGAPASDPDQGWHLEEFDAGWLIRRRATGNLRGTASHAVERASGRLMRFASYIPPERILEEYDQVVVRGFPEEPRPATLALHEFSAPADTV